MPALLPDSQRIRILIAEDTTLLRTLLTEYVQNLGYEAAAVADGQEALTAVATKPPDLLLCDINMPRVDGLEVCRRLKADPATRPIPVVLMTGTMVEYLAPARAVGADAFLEKPFSIAQLQTQIHALLRPRSTSADPEWREVGGQTDKVCGKRRFSRLAVSLPVIGRVGQFPGELRGGVWNISRGGLMAEFPVVVAPGSVMRLLLKTRLAPVEVTGRVVWISAAESKTRHGVAFPEPKGRDFMGNLVRAEGG